MTTATKYKTYSKYKPSGVDWLGKIAEGWKVEYMKNLGRFESSGIDKKIVEGEPLVQMVNYTDIYGNESRVIDGKRELMTVSCPAWKVPEANVLKGDLVFTPSSETIEDIGLSALISEDLANTVFSYHVIRFRFFEKLDHGFKKYLCNNDFVLQQFSSVAKGTTRQILDRNDFKNIIVVIPPAESQKQIADFLDRKTAKINEAVTKKQKLIQLLKEKRQALITHAVTKGLDPKAKMKPSGIDWLDDIPEGWEVKKIKHFSNAIAGGTPSTENESYWYDGNIPWLPSGMCQDNIIYQEDVYKFITPRGLEESSTKKIKPDSVLVALTGATCANIAYLTFEATANQSVIGLEVNKKTHPKFIFYYLLSQRWQILLSQTGGAQAGVNKEDVKNLICVYPALEIQKSIADFLDRETAKIDEMMKKVETQIEKLQEYRQALITNAVTGKIKI